jgi:hypothetical protein
VVDVSARAGGPPVYGFWFRQEVPRARVGINDFMGIYAGARLVGTSEQFNADAYLREQVRATGWSAPSILYTRLPAFAFVVRPLGQMQYLHAYYVWEALSLACFAGFLVLWPAPSREWLLVAACWSFPLFADIFGGQDVAFVLLVLTVVWRWGSFAAFHCGRRAGACDAEVPSDFVAACVPDRAAKMADAGGFVLRRCGCGRGLLCRGARGMGSRVFAVCSAGADESQPSGDAQSAWIAGGFAAQPGL